MNNLGKIMGYAYTVTPIALTICPNIYQINAKSLVFYSMVRYADYLIYIRINIWKHKKLKKIKDKIRGYTYKMTHISADNFPSVAHLVSY